MTINSKNSIYEENKIVINKIEIYMSKKMQFFWLNDIEKYQLLIP